MASYSFSHLPPTGAWTPNVSGGVGVIGGIPTRTNLINVTLSPYFADKTGATNAYAAIQAAIDAASAEDVIYLPTGTYKILSRLLFNSTAGGRNNLSLRGDGIGLTIIDCRTTDDGILIGFDSFGSAVTVTGTAQGSTTLTMADTSGFTVNQLAIISTANQMDNTAITAGAYPVFHDGGFLGIRRMVTKVTARDATTITINPPLYYGSTLATTAKPFSCIRRVGIENLTFDCSNGSTVYGLHFDQTNECWVSNVRIIKPVNYNVFYESSLNGQVTDSYLDQQQGSGTNGAGLLANTVSATLVQNSIIYKVFPLSELNSGWCGNVFAYNYLLNSTVSGGVGAGILANHGPHNSFNLYEGNEAPCFESDGYFGSSSEDTVFRNWYTSISAGAASPRSPILLKRFSRGYELVANMLGTSGQNVATYNLGTPNVGFDGPGSPDVQPTLGTFWVDWKLLGTLTTRTDATNGVFTSSTTVGSAASAAFYTAQGPNGAAITWNGGANRANITFALVNVSGSALTFTYAAGTNDNLPTAGTACQLWLGTNGSYQEQDLDVQASSIFKANYNTQDGAIPAGEIIATTLPTSLYLAAKPTWFGYLAYPSFDSSNPNFSEVATPAGYRYVNGVAPPASPVSTSAMSGAAKLSGAATIK